MYKDYVCSAVEAMLPLLSVVYVGLNVKWRYGMRLAVAVASSPFHGQCFVIAYTGNHVYPFEDFVFDKDQ